MLDQEKKNEVLNEFDYINSFINGLSENAQSNDELNWIIARVESAKENVQKILDREED